MKKGCCFNLMLFPGVYVVNSKNESTLEKSLFTCFEECKHEQVNLIFLITFGISFKICKAK